MYNFKVKIHIFLSMFISKVLTSWVYVSFVIYRSGRKMQSNFLNAYLNRISSEKSPFSRCCWSIENLIYKIKEKKIIVTYMLDDRYSPFFYLKALTLIIRAPSIRFHNYVIFIDYHTPPPPLYFYWTVFRKD